MPHASSDTYTIESTGDRFSVRRADDCAETIFPTLMAAVDAGREAALSRFRVLGTKCCTSIRLADGSVIDDVCFGDSERSRRRST